MSRSDAAAAPAEEGRPGADQPVRLDPSQLLDHLGDALVVADASGHIREINRAASVLLGRERADLVGAPLSELMPARMRSAHVAGFNRFLRTREPRLIGRSVRVPALRADGSEVDVELTLSVLRSPDGDLFLGSLRDITDQVQLEHELSRSRYVRAAAEVALRLSDAGSVELRDAAPALFAAIGESLDWQVGTLWEPDAGGDLRCQYVWTAPGVTAEPFAAACRSARFRPGIGLPGRVWAEARAEWISDTTSATGFPRAPVARESGLRSGFAFPVPVGGGSGAVIELFATEPREPDEDLLLTFATIGKNIGQFLQRTRAERAARDRLEFLARTGQLLDRSLDLDRTLQQVVTVAVPLLGDVAVGYLAQPGEPPRTAVAAADAVVERRVRDAVRAAPVVPGESLLRRAGLADPVVVPIAARRGLRGAIELAATAPGRVLGADEQALAHDLARRAGLALDNAVLFTERSYVARRLQETLLPAELPAVPRVELAVRYVAAGTGVDVGGDFFDVVPAAEGRWTVLVGDVCGKGVEAAAVAGLARHTIRALALRDSDPQRLLRDLNAALLQRGEQGPRFCTVALGQLSVGADEAVVGLCCAGHPLPAVLRADGTVTYVGRPGDLLGVLDEVEVPVEQVRLRAGDTLVVYTDGVVERREGDRFFGETGLQQLLEGLVGRPAEEIVAAVERTVAEFQPEPPRDDLAVLAVRFTG